MTTPVENETKLDLTKVVTLESEKPENHEVSIEEFSDTLTASVESIFAMVDSVGNESSEVEMIQLEMLLDRIDNEGVTEATLEAVREMSGNEELTMEGVTETIGAMLWAVAQSILVQAEDKTLQYVSRYTTLEQDIELLQATLKTIQDQWKKKQTKKGEDALKESIQISYSGRSSVFHKDGKPLREHPSKAIAEDMGFINATYNYNAALLDNLATYSQILKGADLSDDESFKKTVMDKLSDLKAPSTLFPMDKYKPETGILLADRGYQLNQTVGSKVMYFFKNAKKMDPIEAVSRNIYPILYVTKFQWAHAAPLFELTPKDLTETIQSAIAMSKVITTAQGELGRGLSETDAVIKQIKAMQKEMKGASLNAENIKAMKSLIRYVKISNNCMYTLPWQIMGHCIDVSRGLTVFSKMASMRF